MSAVAEVTNIVTSCVEDLHELWSGPAFRKVLDAHGLHPEDNPGLYVSDSLLSPVKPNLKYI